MGNRIQRCQRWAGFASGHGRATHSLRAASVSALLFFACGPVELNARILTVAADGAGDYRSVQMAIDQLPETGGTVRIRRGIYREVLQIGKSHVRLEGDAAHPSRVEIVFNNSAATAGGTLKSATVIVSGDDFFARGITFANDFNYSAAPTPHQGTQAVALEVTGDRAVFRNDRFLGAQDTLYTGSKSCIREQGPCTPARQFFSDCYIEGHVDFICGDGKTVFRHCEIHARQHNSVMLTAQSRHYPNENSGYVFDRCKVTADAGATDIYLGRPWRPYSTVVFLNANLQAQIEPDGWREWHPGETHSLETATYAEYHSSGPGAATARREPHALQLSRVEAKHYSPEIFLADPDGWNPARVK